MSRTTARITRHGRPRPRWVSIPCSCRFGFVQQAGPLGVNSFAEICGIIEVLQFNDRACAATSASFNKQQACSLRPDTSQRPSFTHRRSETPVIRSVLTPLSPVRVPFGDLVFFCGKPDSRVKPIVSLNQLFRQNPRMPSHTALRKAQVRSRSLASCFLPPRRTSYGLSRPGRCGPRDCESRLGVRAGRIRP